MLIFNQKMPENRENYSADNLPKKQQTVANANVSDSFSESAKENIVSLNKFKEPEKKALFSIPLFEEDFSGNEPIKKKKDFDDVWSFYRDAGSASSSVNSQSQLRSALGVDSDWNLNKPIKLTFFTKTELSGTKALIEKLDSYGMLTPRVMSDLAEIAKKHGVSTLDSVCNDFNKYLSAYSNPGEMPKEVVVNGLHDLAYPSDIDQKSKGTCAGASAQMKLAIEKPQKYTDILLTLAKGNDYKISYWTSISPNNTWVGDSNDNRNYSAKIMQNALLEFGDDDYDSKGGKDGTGNHGLDSFEQQSVLETIFANGDYDNNTEWDSSKDSLYSYLEDDLARGRTVQASFDGHSVLVVGIDKTKAEDQVIINSWGSQYSMPVSKFKEYLKSVRTIDDSGFDNRIIAGNKVILGDK